MVKITFTGTHGTGKTTLAHKLVYNLKKENVDVGLLQEIARESPFPINQQVTKKAQIWIILNQIIKEIELEEKNDVLICDRSILDGYCYYIYKFGRSKILEPLIIEHLKTYKYIIKVPIREGFLVKDKVRSIDPKFQKDIDTILNKMLKTFKIRYIDYKNLEEDFIKSLSIK